MSITLNQLLAVLAVVDCGTFARAAGKLNLTQSTITKRIQELESSLGFSVFDRSKRQAILTANGEQFVSLSRETVTSFEKLTSFNSGSRISPNIVRLGVTEISSLTWLPKFLETSYTTDPGTQIQLTIDMTRSLLSSLEDGELDLIVVPEMPFQSGARVQHVGDIEIALIARPGLLPTSGRIEISDLQAFEFITQGKASGYSKSIRDWFSNYGVNTRSSVSVDSLHAMVGLAVAGRGVCIAPKDYLLKLIESGRVAEIRTNPELPIMRYCVVYNPSPHEALFTRIASDISCAADFKTPYFI